MFKAALLLLKDNEEKLLAIPFEMMLAQIVNLPPKFFIV